MKSYFKYYTLICMSLALSENQIFCSADESKPQWPSTPSPDWDDWSLPPGVTLLPPDWNDDARVDAGDLGIIQGTANLTLPLLGSRKFYSFAGIPYAKPESYTTENRFKPSEQWTGTLPADDDTGVFLATDYLIKCPQDTETETDEKCLVLNVETWKIPPKDEYENLSPVVVFIHGGSFDSGWSGQYRGQRFLRKDVVFVSMNYRLGVLGFLNLGIEGAPGNAALYDIVTGLKWIQTNIKYFGGDKTKITVTGHSAGAGLATHLLTSNLADTLVHGIIGFSGSSLSQIMATSTDPLPYHLRVSQLAGCYNGSGNPDPQNIRECMAKKPIPELLQSMKTYTDSEIDEGLFGLGAKLPSLQDESKIGTTPAFITDSPYNVLKEGKQLDIPIMMGVARHDGSYLVDQTLERFWRPHDHIHDPLFLRNQLLPTLIDAFDLKDDSGEMIHSLQKMYIGDAIHTDDFEAKVPGLIDLYGVLAFKAGAYNLVELHSKKNPKSYHFSFDYGKWHASGGSAIPVGIGHTVPLNYLFTFNPLILPKDFSVSEEFINLWVNFATYGNPNGKGPRAIAAPYNPLNHAYLVIDGSFRTGYYCRDAWLNNALELMNNEPVDPSTTTELSTPPTGNPSSSTTSKTPAPKPKTTTPTTNTAYTVKFNVLSIACIILSYVFMNSE